ncbi:MAG: hypothetical protein ABI914_01750 [Acidobacteriota bacterium]
MTRGPRSWWSAAIAVALFAATAAISLRGAASAAPGIGVAAPDLDLLRRWNATGRLESDPGSAHLTKSGYLLYLRTLLPSEGQSPSENRRFLFFNAGWLLVGEAAAAVALWRAQLRSRALFLLAFLLLYVPLRDAADYVATEAIGSGLCMIFGACLVDLPRGRTSRAALLGVFSPLIVLVRPNVGWLLLASAAATILFSAGHRPRMLLSLSAGALLCTALLITAGRLTHSPLSPLNVNSSMVLMWGTADYYWLADTGQWPVGPTPEETSTLQARRAGERWAAFLGRGGPDMRRSLVWRFTHSLLSAEQLPGLVPWPRYLEYDRNARRFWFIAATAIAALGIACLVGKGPNPYRAVPALLLSGCVAQGVLFGADPRLALPLIPLVVLAILLALPRRPGPAFLAVAAGCAVALATAIATAPDTTSSDFVLVRGPARVLSETLPPGRIPAGEIVTVHCRVLRPEPLRLGVNIFANGTLLVSRDAAEASPFPAFFTGTIGGEVLAAARREGLRLEVRTVGSADSSDAFIFSPVFPGSAFSSTVAKLDGSSKLPSGYGGTIRGEIPVWLHPGADGP